MTDRIPMAGIQIGAILILASAGTRNGRALWRCRCLACGEEFDERGGNLRKAQRRADWVLHRCKS